MRGDVALAGDLTLDLDALAVRLVRVAAPFADEFAARRASAKLERALYERVASFTTAFAGGPAAGAAPAAPAALPHNTLVLPAASDILAVVTDRPHAQIVGLFLNGDVRDQTLAFEVFDPADKSEARDVLKAVLPSALARAAAERLQEKRRWARFGEAQGVSTFARVPSTDDPASFFPTGAYGDAKEKVVAAVELATAPVVFLASKDEDDDDDDDDASFRTRRVPGTGTRRVSVETETNTNTNAENRDIQRRTSATERATTHAFAFPSVRVFATRLARASAPIVAADAAEIFADVDDADVDASSFATAAPLLREEALVVSLLDEPPPAYGHVSFESFLEAFAAEYGVSLAALRKAEAAFSAPAKDGGETCSREKKKTRRRAPFPRRREVAQAPLAFVPAARPARRHGGGREDRAGQTRGHHGDVARGTRRGPQRRGRRASALFFRRDVFFSRARAQRGRFRSRTVFIRHRRRRFVRRRHPAARLGDVPPDARRTVSDPRGGPPAA